MTLCWFTFWGGLLFYLGHSQPGAIPHSVHVTMSIGIVTMNVIFLIYISYKFGQEYFLELKIKKKKKKKLCHQDCRVHVSQIKPMKESKEKQVVPTRNSEDVMEEVDNVKDNENESNNNGEVKNWGTKHRSKPVSTVVGTKSSLAITVMLLVGSLVVGVAEGTSVLERGDVVGSSLIAFDTTTPVWNERVDDRYCVVKRNK